MASTSRLTTTAHYDGKGHLVAVVAPGNRETDYTYNNRERVATTVERAGTDFAATSSALYLETGETQQTIDAAGLKTSLTFDVLGQVINTYQFVGGFRNSYATYDALGRVASTTDPRGNVTAIAYDDKLRTVTLTDALSKSTVDTYDLACRVVSSANQYGKATTFTYDLPGRVTAATDPLGHATKYRYLVGGTADAVDAPLGRTTTTTYDRFGQVASVSDPLAHATQFTYDDNGNLLTITDPRSTVTKATHDSFDRVHTVTEADGTSLARTTTSDYDTATGDLVHVTDPLGRRTDYRYDDAGRVDQVTLAATSATTTPYVIGATYDAAGRVASVTLPGDRTSAYAYDAAGDLLEADQGVGTDLLRSSTYEYDPAGNRVSATDPLGHGTVTNYDALNRPYQTVDAVGATTTLAYDDAGRLKSLTDPVSNVTSWTYDDAGRKTAETDPNSKVTHYGYDAADRLTSITDRLGHIRTYQYNAADQMTGEIWYPDSKSSAVHAVAYGRDENGNLTSATDALSSGNSAFDTSISYDLLNRPTHVAEPFGVTLDYQYDAADNRTQVVDNQGGQTDSTYDDLNRLTTMTLSGSGVTGTRTTWGYDASGDMVSIGKETKVSGSWTASGSTTYGHDDLGRVDAITQKNGAGTTVGAYTFTLDLGDRLTASKYVTGSVTSSHSFGYDDSNRLTSADGSTFTYDDAGNPTGTGYTLGVANRMTSDGVWTYTYDDAGQMTGKSKSGEAWAYTYDYNGQMVSASKSATVGGTVTDSVAYTFDALGNRLSRVQSGGTSKTERFAYDGADAFLDLNGSNAVTERRQYGPGVDNLLSRQAGGTVEWYGTDSQGSVRQVFDNMGKQTSWADYEAHGALVGGSLSDRYGFTGRELDGLTGQQYNRARVLDGQTWTSEDPMGFGAGDANLRRYGGGNPTTGRDPSGLVDSYQKSLPQNASIPSWFWDLDTDGDGQVGLYEWRAAGLNTNDFLKLDTNNDFLLTPGEMLAQGITADPRGAVGRNAPGGATGGGNSPKRSNPNTGGTSGGTVTLPGGMGSDVETFDHAQSVAGFTARSDIRNQLNAIERSKHRDHLKVFVDQLNELTKQLDAGNLTFEELTSIELKIKLLKYAVAAAITTREINEGIEDFGAFLSALPVVGIIGVAIEAGAQSANGDTKKAATTGAVGGILAAIGLGGARAFGKVARGAPIIGLPNKGSRRWELLRSLSRRLNNLGPGGGYKGNSGVRGMGESLAKITRDEADYLGKEFVGEGYRVLENGFLLSKDGTRLYRPPSLKPGSPFTDTGTQANYIIRKYNAETKKWEHTCNGHVDILP